MPADTYSPLHTYLPLTEISEDGACNGDCHKTLPERMQWVGIEKQGEALPLRIHRLHEFGPDCALSLLEVRRHEITISPVVARKLELAYRREALRIGLDL